MAKIESKTRWRMAAGIATSLLFCGVVGHSTPSQLSLRYLTFFSMDDPRAAAMAMRLVGSELGMELKRPLYETTTATMHILLPGGRINTFDMNDHARREFVALLGKEPPERRFTCAVQFYPAMSPDDIICTMERGIRVLSYIHNYALIVRVTSEEIEWLAEQESVRWLHRIRAEDKYYRLYDMELTSTVTPFFGDYSEYREELSRLGLNVIDYGALGYTVWADRTKLIGAANLWWVNRVYQHDKVPDGGH